MEKIKRKAFFWILVLAFFVIAPVIILNARGYRFDTHRGVFVYGGAVTVKANPQSVDISLNGESVTGKVSQINSSHSITGLLPGDYSVQIGAAGFKPWSKKTDVHSGIASEFWNVLLVRDNYEKINYADTEGIDKFFVSPKNDFITYTSSGTDALAIKIFNISSEKTENNFDIAGWQMAEEERKENIEWSPEEDYLSVPVKRNISPSVAKNKKNISEIYSETVEYNYFIIDPQNKSSFNLNEFLGKKNIADVRWDPRDKDFLFFLEDKSLFRANITDAADIALIAQDVSSFNFTKSDVYYVQSPNNLVFKSSFDGQSGKAQITNSFPGNADLVIDRLIIYDDSRLAFITKNKDLFVYNEGEHDTYFRKLGENVEGLHFSDDGKKLLFWDNSEISVYFARDWKVQPVRAENDLTDVTRYSEPIKNVQWFRDYEHVIFNTGKWVKIIELDDRDHRNCMDLINTQMENPVIRYNNSLEYLYFTDSDGGNTTLRSMVFPEPTPILGIGG